MSFDILFQPSRYAGETVEKKNPFTGEMQAFLDHEPLTDDEYAAVQQVLKNANASNLDEFGAIIVKFADGGYAEIQADDLRLSCMISVSGMTTSLVSFLFQFLKAGNWVMLPVMEDSIAITATPELMTGTPADFPQVITCKSADELEMLLSKGLKAWEKYRDQVVGDN